MSDFVSGLRSELVAAAAREERRRVRWLPRAAAAAARPGAGRRRRPRVRARDRARPEPPRRGAPRGQPAAGRAAAVRRHDRAERALPDAVLRAGAQPQLPRPAAGSPTTPTSAASSRSRATAARRTPHRSERRDLHPQRGDRSTTRTSAHARAQPPHGCGRGTSSDGCARTPDVVPSRPREPARLAGHPARVMDYPLPVRPSPPTPHRSAAGLPVRCTAARPRQRCAPQRRARPDLGGQDLGRGRGVHDPRRASARRRTSRGSSARRSRCSPSWRSATDAPAQFFLTPGVFGHHVLRREQRLPGAPREVFPLLRRRRQPGGDHAALAGVPDRHARARSRCA